MSFSLQGFKSSVGSILFRTPPPSTKARAKDERSVAGDLAEPMERGNRPTFSGGSKGSEQSAKEVRLTVDVSRTDGDDDEEDNSLTPTKRGDGGTGEGLGRETPDGSKQNPAAAERKRAETLKGATDLSSGVTVDGRDSGESPNSSGGTPGGGRRGRSR